MGSYDDNAQLRRGKSMVNVEAERLSDVLLDNGEAGARTESSLRMTAAGMMKRRRTSSEPKLGRLNSGIARGFKGIRFLERSATGKELDAWRTMERRFDENAEGGRLCRDKFGACIGMLFLEFLLSSALHGYFVFNLLRRELRFLCGFGLPGRNGR